MWIKDTKRNTIAITDLIIHNANVFVPKVA